MKLMFLFLLNNDFNFFLCLGIKYNMGFQQPKKVSFQKYIRKIVPISWVHSAYRDGSAKATRVEMKHWQGKTQSFAMKYKFSF